MEEEFLLLLVLLYPNKLWIPNVLGEDLVLDFVWDKTGLLKFVWCFQDYNGLAPQVMLVIMMFLLRFGRFPAMDPSRDKRPPP